MNCFGCNKQRKLIKNYCHGCTSTGELVARKHVEKLKKAAKELLKQVNAGRARGDAVLSTKTVEAFGVGTPDPVAVLPLEGSEDEVR